MGKITLKWHGHSCFSVTADDYTIVLDPFADGSVPGLPNLDLHANRVLCSHQHSDHGCTDVVTVSEQETSVPATLFIPTRTPTKLFLQILKEAQCIRAT